MTLNSKALSLVILSGLTMGSLFAKIQPAATTGSLKRSQAALIRATNNVVPEQVSKLAATAAAPATCSTCSAVTPGSCTGCTSCPPCTTNCLTDCTTCPNQCNPGVCQCTAFCATDCSKLTPCNLEVQEPLCFKTFLYAENVLTGNIPPVPQINPNNQSPITCGTFELCFSPNTQAFCYRIVLCGQDVTVGKELKSWVGSAESAVPTTQFFNIIKLNSSCVVNNGTSLIQTGCVTQAQYVFNGANGNTPIIASAANFIPTYWSTSANLCCLGATPTPQTVQVAVVKTIGSNDAVVRGTQLVAAAAA